MELATIDAYAHVGTPRFGTAPEALGMFERSGIEKGVLVLGPGVPDFQSLYEARQMAGDRIRYMGIPIGETESQRNELAELQLHMGISGMRLMPFEIAPNPLILQKLGERGLWLYAINPHQDGDVTRLLLQWVEEYPEGRIASPHFLFPAAISEAADDPAVLRELLQHPRFYAILSRHGGASRQNYPHADLLRWTSEVLDLVTWDRVMWGSEHPVLYWRNECVQGAWEWIQRVGLEVSQGDLRRFYRGNAQRLFFDEAAPEMEPIDIPRWVRKLFSNAPVALAQRGTLNLPAPAYAELLSGYLRECESNPGMRLNDYLAEELIKRMDNLD